MKKLYKVGVAAVAGLILTGCNEETILSNVNLAGELEEISRENDVVVQLGLGEYVVSPLSEGAEVRLNVVGSVCPEYEDGNVSLVDLVGTTSDDSFLQIDDMQYRIKSTICGNSLLESEGFSDLIIELGLDESIASSIESFGVWTTADLVTEEGLEYNGTVFTNSSTTEFVEIENIEIESVEITATEGQLRLDTNTETETEVENDYLIGVARFSADAPWSLKGQTVFAVCDVTGNDGCPQYVGVLNLKTPLELMQIALDDARANGTLSYWKYRSLSRDVSRASYYASRGWNRLASYRLRRLLWSAGRSSVPAELRSELTRQVARYNAG